MSLTPYAMPPNLGATAGAPRASSRNLRHTRTGAVLVMVLITFAVLGPLLTSHDPNASDFVRGITPDNAPAGPSVAHWLGTDRLFRDVFARLAFGARTSLLIGTLSTAIAVLIGSTVGMLAGWYEGQWLDTALMRLVDIGLAFPSLLAVMALGAVFEQTTALTILLLLGLTGWLGIARVIRAKTLQIRSLEFVTASRALGQSTPQLLLRHVLPNVAGPIVVLATVLVGQMILAESALSYLGTGMAPPRASWGHMLFEGQDALSTAPWIAGAPAAAILVAVFGFNLLGEGLRDALDPKRT
jgi:ABC-type dipeptide/oligopeptide/nickel transport system permease subunit